MILSPRTNPVTTGSPCSSKRRRGALHLREAELVVEQHEVGVETKRTRVPACAPSCPFEPKQGAQRLSVTGRMALFPG
jgi:hypothetical protein